MKKIMFYINAIHHGGAERVMVNLANMFSQRSYEVLLVTSFLDREEYALSSNVRRLSLEENDIDQSFIKKNVTRINKLREICKKERPDILVSFMAEANFRAILATRFLGIKTLISVRNDPRQEYLSLLFKAAAKILYPFASGCVFQTEDAKMWFSRTVQKKSRIILNQVDEKFYRVNLKGDRRDIVTVGRLESQKNQKLLIEAFAQIAKDFPEDNLRLYGDGELRQSLAGLAASLGISNRISFMGACMDIQDKIKDARIFVLSSDYEGLPNAVMEAMALGIPVISTDCPCGGPRLLIKNNINGILVSTGNKEELTQAMRRLLSDKKYTKKISVNAKIRAMEFRPEKVFEMWEDYINSI
jgi:glycosyltransferase involved in cell wall biosynthesis